jgi:hypothetical protein
MDRAELRGGLQRSCFLNGGLFTVFAVCVIFKVNVIVLYALCAALGYSISGIWGGFRALLVVAVGPDRLRRAHFVESFMVEASYGAGPLIVTILAEPRHSHRCIPRGLQPYRCRPAAPSSH